MQNAEQADFQPFDASTWKIGLVVAQFNKHITGALQASALERAKEYGLKPENIIVVPVAGAVEVPLVLQKMAKSNNYDALMAVGCVIKGVTPHFDYVCKFVSEGVLRVQLDTGTPIAFGVLTCNNQAEAQKRMHLGGEHLDAVMHQARVMRELT